MVRGLNIQKRELETGQFNDDFIEIKTGLKEGEKILLRPPESGELETGRKKPDEGGKENSKPGEKPASPRPAPPGKA